MRLRAPVALVFCALSLSAFAEPAQIKIGEVIDRTGSIATPSWFASVGLAVHDVNAALEQAGRDDVRFALVGADSKNSAEAARAAAVELVHKQGAKAIITDSSQDDMAIHGLVLDKDPAQRIEVPVMCMACTNPLINSATATDPNPRTEAGLRNADGYNFRTTASDGYQAQVIAHWLESLGDGGDVNGDHVFKVSIYASDDPYGRGFSDSLKSQITSPKKISVEQIFHPLQADSLKYDWAADATKLLDGRNENTGAEDGAPDAVVEITFPKYAAAFTRAYLQKKSDVRLIHTHNFRSVRVTSPIGNLIEGQEGTSQAVLGTGPGAAAFAAELKETTGHAPAFRDATAYDAAATLMLAALTNLPKGDPASITGAQIRDGLKMINQPQGTRVAAGKIGLAAGMIALGAHRAINYEGASGPCDFDALGNVVSDITRFRFERAEFVDVQRFSCTKNAKCPAER